ncbi:MAG: hypothetical protein O3C60_05915 [Planctomycetota bacterium]|nr:hypothetical protein [Planctomycetota bacterium]
MPASKLSADSVVLETVTFRLPLGDIKSEDFWQQVDEQRIDTDTRRRLESNGFRIGIVGSQLPPLLTRHLDAEVGQPPSTVRQGDSFVTTPQTLSRRRGVPFEIASPENHEQLQYLRLTANGSLVGETLAQAQCLLIAKPFPRNDSDLDLTIEPVVSHGQPRQRFVPGDGASIRTENSADKRHFPELRWEIRLSPGESLLMTCTEDTKGLGRAFFTDETSGQRRQRLVLIRLAQTQRDDLFPLGMTTAPSNTEFP